MRIAFLSWRDLTHPEGGGAERYAQTVCSGLAARGHDITLLCAAHGDAPEQEHLDGYRILRQGGRASVYPATVRRLRELERTEGHFDVVVDIQNGLPFGSRLGTLSPVVVLIHHVHKEQWPVVFNRAVASVGWFLESRISPWLYRGCQYVTVSGRTRDELVELGVDAEDVSVIHNGTELPWSTRESRTEHPSLVVLGRLVPHKRVELAIDTAQRLRHRFPGLRLRVVGDGWWRERVEEHARSVGADDIVDVLGFVDEVTKHHELSSAWVSLAPSLKEGWGLNVIEAAIHGAPTVAFHDAGGLSESVVDGYTGTLAHDLDEFVEATAELLADHHLRHEMDLAARAHARRFSWGATVDSWERTLARAAAHRPAVAEIDQVVAAPERGGHRPGRRASA